MFATVAGTPVAVDGTNTSSYSEWTGSEGDCVGTDTTQNPCARWTVGLHCSELLQGRESNTSLISWHPSRLRRVARSSSAAETRAAADSDDEAVFIRLCLKEVLFGQLDLQNWQSEARQIPAALVVDCRGVHGALARSSSSCLGLKDKKSGLEALALKQSLVECGTVIR